MDCLWLIVGFVLGNASCYLWYRIGRVVAFQDKNIIPPPHPVSIPVPSIVPKEKANPIGWVDDYSDPSLGEFKKGAEL